MIDFSEMLKIAPYSLNKKEKEELLGERLRELTEKHFQNCMEYRRFLNAFDFSYVQMKKIEQCPFLAVRMFKDLELKSIPKEEIVKTMTSSGTTGQQVSKIFLDRATAANQQKTLVKIVSDFTGRARLPMLIIDSPAVVKNRQMFSARGAGILGFSILASDRKYALTEDMNLDFEGIREFLEKHKGERILLFGFTFMIWQYFYKALKQNPAQIDLSNGVMIHGGGWKKLQDEAVEPEEFKQSLKEVCGLLEVHDYYGMVEQTGCIYMECECGHLHTSIFSDVITRRAEDFSECDFGEEGIIQVVSSIPESYPGHSVLTEDKGIILGEDDCPCGRMGKYFKVTGRIKNAEIRGCSDTYEQR